MEGHHFHAVDFCIQNGRKVNLDAETRSEWRSEIAADGSLVPMGQQQYMWIDTILRKLQQPVNPLSSIPSHSLKHLNIVVGGLHTFAGDNVMSGVYLLGKLKWNEV